jgi:DNA repair photolyase
MLLDIFDPWKSPLCTCPKKLTFNPYTGCDHGCLYCYASSYIPNFQDCRPKTNLLSRLKKEAIKLKGEIISVSNSSDPYPRLERKLGLTRQCLEILAKSHCKIQIVTKSDLVVKDIDILQDVSCVVSVTILTLDDLLSSKLEPGAPVSSKRVKAIEELVDSGIPTTVRVDPVIPLINDDFDELIKTIADIGVLHVTSSTYKIKPDNWNRFTAKFPETSEKLRASYFDNGKKIGSSIYLSEKLRFELMNKMKIVAEKNNLKFGCCREGFNLNSAVCDGTWAIEKNIN